MTEELKMKKLTKEQAECVLEAMKKQRNEIYWKALIGPNEMAFMEKAITQCTEKEFPAFKKWNIVINHHGVQKDICIEKVVDGKTEGWVLLTNNEFREFTQGCQKIVDWLEENND